MDEFLDSFAGNDRLARTMPEPVEPGQLTTRVSVELLRKLRFNIPSAEKEFIAKLDKDGLFGIVLWLRACSRCDPEMGHRWLRRQADYYIACLEEEEKKAQELWKWRRDQQAKRKEAERTRQAIRDSRCIIQ